MTSQWYEVNAKHTCNISRKRPGNAYFSIFITDNVKRSLAKKGALVKSRVIATTKKPQTFVLRIWERAEGTRYELRSLSGKRKTFKSLEDMEHQIESLAQDDVSEQEVNLF